MSVQWVQVGDVASDSEPGLRYAIKIRRADQHLGCDCLAYRFAPKVAKTCKHIRAWRAGEAVDARPVRPTVRPEQVRVQSNGEMFTVTRRRAIAFGAVPF